MEWACLALVGRACFDVWQDSHASSRVFEIGDGGRRTVGVGVAAVLLQWDLRRIELMGKGRS